MRTILSGWALFIALVSLASAAGAVSFSPDPFGLGSGAGLGTVDVVDVLAGLPTNSTQLAGSTAPGDLTIVFRYALSTGPFDGLGAGARTPAFDDIAPTGGGVLAGAGLLPQATLLGAGGLFFDYGAGGITAQTLLPSFFVSFASLSPGDLFTASVTHIIETGGGGGGGRPPIVPGGQGGFGVRRGGSTTLVPEPGLPFLAAAVCALLWIAARRRGGSAAIAGARLDLLRRGQTRSVQAALSTDPAENERTFRLRDEKYAVQRLGRRIGLFGDGPAPDTVTLRLDPCS